MGYEVDFLSVGNSGPGGDAIALRIGDLKSHDRGNHFVAVVDGGYTSHGSVVADHIRRHYNPDLVDVVVSTHLDRDHIQGLMVVVREMNVGQLWMHEPTSEDEAALRSEATAAFGMRKERLDVITASLSDSRDLAQLARDRGVEVIAPYAGLAAADGAFQVIGPSVAYYEELVPQFREYRSRKPLAAMIEEAVEARTGKMLRETLEHETLEAGARTTPENNSSVVSLITVGGRAVILTGDAGEPALKRAASHLDDSGFDWNTVRAMQIPHHGSRENVTPSILDHYLGPKVQEARTKQAVVSCSKRGEPLHPARRVTNAFYRRGCKVYKTAGSTVRLHHDAPPRTGFERATEVDFYHEVD